MVHWQEDLTLGRQLERPGVVSMHAGIRLQAAVGTFDALKEMLTRAGDDV